MQIKELEFPGVLLLTPNRFGDDRGYFSESWNKRTMADHGLEFDFVQDNHSLSIHTGTIRGMHFQAPPHAQTKLVRCGRGALLDVVLDIRTGSPTYGRSATVELSEANGQQLLVPRGFAHGFVTLTENTEIAYKCDNFYNKEADRVLRWDSCGIDWGLSEPPIISPKDAEAPGFDGFNSPFVWEG